MNKKIIAIRPWESPRFDRFIEDFNQELNFFHRELEKCLIATKEEYNIKYNQLVNLYENPKLENIKKLLDSLSEKDLDFHGPRHMSKEGFTEHFVCDCHFGIAEFRCLAKHIKLYWGELSVEQQEQFVEFLIKKTNDTLGSAAECVTTLLKGLVELFIEFVPDLDETLQLKIEENIETRRRYYKTHKSQYWD
ncbi:MAG: hypothetical protein PHF25_03345 [Candidatus Margulisbacteria bacterium]|nr:hypothetical protein [Candidatus Margulisiibacteriota bacterium]